MIGDLVADEECEIDLFDHSFFHLNSIFEFILFVLFVLLSVDRKFRIPNSSYDLFL